MKNLQRLSAKFLNNMIIVKRKYIIINEKVLVVNIDFHLSKFDLNLVHIRFIVVERFNSPSHSPFPTKIPLCQCLTPFGL